MNQQSKGMVWGSCRRWGGGVIKGMVRCLLGDPRVWNLLPGAVCWDGEGSGRELWAPGSALLDLGAGG